MKSIYLAFLIILPIIISFFILFKKSPPSPSSITPSPFSITPSLFSITPSPSSITPSPSSITPSLFSITPSPSSITPSPSSITPSPFSITPSPSSITPSPSSITPSPSSITPKQIKNMEIIPVDCTYTPSNAVYSPCSAKYCGTTGQQSRPRYMIVSQPSSGGKCPQENDFDVVPCSAVACPTLYDNYVNNINFIRSSIFNLPGAGWAEYYGKHPDSVYSVQYLVDGIVNTNNQTTLNNLTSFQLDEYRNDPIKWKNIKFDGEIGKKIWYILSACLSIFMKTKNQDYIKLFMRITNDYFTNNKGAVNGIDKQYTFDSAWCLTQSSLIINVLSEIGGFLKFIDKKPLTVSDFDKTWKQGSNYFFSPEQPLNSDQIQQLLTESFSPEVYSNIRKGLLVDHSKELIMVYKYRGKVPNQRMEGILALLMMSNVFNKKYCNDDITNYNYEYTLTDPDSTKTYTRRMTRLSDIVINIEKEAIDGLSLCLREQFWDDGPMLERSLNYNIGVILKLSEIRLYIEDSTTLNFMDEKITRYNDFLDGITTQNNIIPPFGNIGQQGMTRIPGVVYKNSVCYPMSGFSVLRNKDLYLFMNYGILSRGHQNNSSYSIVLSAFNKILFTMAGPSMYDMVKTTDRLYPVSIFFYNDNSFKNCSWIVDNLSRNSIYYNNQWVPLIGIDPVTNILLGTRFGLSDDFDVVQHSMDVEYGLLFGTSLTKTTSKVRVNFSRCTVLSKSDNVFYIIDKITPSDNMKHTYTHPWIFNKDFLPENVVLSNDGFYTTQQNSVNVQVKYYNNTALTHNLYYDQLNSSTPIKTSNTSFVNYNIGPLGYTSTGIAGIFPSVNVLSMSENINGPMISIAQVTPYNSIQPPTTFKSYCTVDEVSGILVKSSISQLKLGWTKNNSSDGFYDMNNLKISDIISR
jgi:hypothetical protein